MSHEVESMFYVNEVPWHKLGKKLHAPPTAKEAIEMAGLDWSVRMIPLYEGNGDHIPGFFGIQRDTDHKTYGVVTDKKYVPLQNKDAFKAIDPLIESGLVQLETAGSLMEGRKIWILGKLARDPIEVVKNDIVQSYLLLTHGHDGKTAVTTAFTPIRVVCNNTLQASLGGLNAKTTWRLVHSQQTMGRLNDITGMIKTLDEVTQKTAESYKFLASKEASGAAHEEYFKAVFGKAKRPISQAFALVQGGLGSDIPGVRGTYWGAYNAVTELIDHRKGKEETKLNSAWFGQGKVTKEKALSLALEMAA